EGMSVADAGFARELDLRYSGQGYELRVPLAGLFHERLTSASLTAGRGGFYERHAPIHRHAANGRPGGVRGHRVGGRGAAPQKEPQEHPAPASPRNAAAVKGKRTITLNGATMQAMLYERARLDVSATVAAPAIVEQFDATTLIPPGWSGRVDGHGNLIL